MTSRKKRWALVGAGLGLIASVSGAALFFELPMSTTATAASAPAQAPAVPVTVAVVAARDVTAWESFSGRLEAVDRVQVRSRVAGAILAVAFREGALVKQGDLLFTIDPAPYQATVAQAQGQVASAEARVSLAQTELDRGHRLSDNRTISQSDLDQRQSALTEAQAGLRSAQAALQSAQLDLDYTQVRAPVSGRIGKIEVTAGNLVAAGSTSPALTTLVSVDPIYASFNASEEMVTRALAQLPQTDSALPPVEQIPVEVGTLTDSGTPIKGKLQLIDNEVDASSGTIGVRAVFDNPGGRLIPGQFVRVRMGQPKAENKIVISDRAVGTDQDKKFVFVVDAENKVAYRQVQLGTLSDGQRVVESGLNAGETIVVNGLQRIRPGAVVAPQMEEKVATAQ
ncbi:MULTISPECIES: efflux RND transporter periplasmic adaptor subunit [unclassified Rhizobium]|uniref:efflux RND transporter periplasmic adaptor subunit n=1 Tax=unclassified Rhizobium TaxID=2613769 RepID=UPI001C83F9B4|nr:MULTISPECIES: efflux RND transporter periplasmic adaptor subunit [unclassified Rhizobium]MBX5160179.1 efflux RND transporter periplasmic adaptor subunit [Rhizobium sp. NZLR8]MBX5165544.1 efflux RND transporter periplasmic adaptor subunit [Rhizobium sp. NZLR4b]MBX5171813.1 efflux RND transporter periplasmic adaptor subunit [Rhizobium sp. NZLR1b]MBX5183209.1 efflux RND transporter periplasmic adaptor subunit [Rhizobium sp. NZLR5]MBX5192929.1 efflux RND transporter periplasmic adaptor subunit 